MNHDTNGQLDLFESTSAPVESSLVKENSKQNLDIVDSTREAKVVSLQNYRKEKEEREVIQWILENTKSF